MPRHTDVDSLSSHVISVTSKSSAMLLVDRIRDVLPRWGVHGASRTRLHKSASLPSIRVGGARYKMIRRAFRTGGNATVDLCTDKLTGRRVILKRVAGDATREAETHRAVCELGHPGFSGFIDVYTEGGHTVIVSEYCEGGDLLDLVRVGEGLPELQALEYAADLLSALARLHSTGYAHADVKIDNCCLSDEGRIKLVDFGGTVSISEVDHTYRPGSSTLTYTAPEVFANKCTDPRCADVWSAGIVLFTLLTGTLPWEVATSRDHSYLRHWRGDESPRWRTLPDDVRALLRAMLHTSPLDRMTAANAHARLVELLAARRRAIEKREQAS